MRAYYAEIVSAVRGFFGATSPQLLHFGLKPKTAPKSPTPTQRVARQVRSQQRRLIRGTTSKKQKQELVFQGQVQVSTQVSSPGSTSGKHGGERVGGFDRLGGGSGGAEQRASWVSSVILVQRKNSR